MQCTGNTKQSKHHCQQSTKIIAGDKNEIKKAGRTTKEQKTTKKKS